MELYATRTVLNLGTGAGTDRMFTDSYYSDQGTGSNYTTIVLDGTGRLFEQSVDAEAKYYCVYQLVR
jgi:hypothetical protein